MVGELGGWGEVMLSFVFWKGLSLSFKLLGEGFSGVGRSVVDERNGGGSSFSSLPSCFSLPFGRVSWFGLWALAMEGFWRERARR